MIPNSFDQNPARGKKGISFPVVFLLHGEAMA